MTLERFDSLLSKALHEVFGGFLAVLKILSLWLDSSNVKFVNLLRSFLDKDKSLAHVFTH